MGNALRRPIEAACHSNIYRPPECCYSTNDCSFVRTRSGMDIAWQLATDDDEVRRRWTANQAYTDSRKLYLFSHGNACDISTCDINWALKVLDGHVLKWDYPGYGQSTDDYVCEQSICESIEAMYSLCQRMKVPSDKLVIVGQSLGTVPALFLASRCYVHAHAVLLISPLASAYRTVFSGRWCPEMLTQYMDGILFDNLKHAAGVRVPVAIIHGLHDDIIDVSHVQMLLAKLPEQAKYPPLKLDASHNDVVALRHDAAIQAYFRRFIEHCAQKAYATPYED